MKLVNIEDVNEFFKVVDSCEGKVELISPEGDRLNLKSKFTQYVALANVFSSGYIRELELVVHESEDVTKFVHYMMQGKAKNE